MVNKLYDVIIIGAGASGMTASLYASRANLEVLLIESSMAGGQMLSTDVIENYSGFETITGEELSENMYKQATAFGATYTEEEVIQLINSKPYKMVLCGGNTVYMAKSVIIATGATHKHLGVIGESEFSGRGVSYCAICDGAFFNNKEVVVVGGGDSAVEEAIYLTKFASKVTIIHRGNKLRAQQVLIDRMYKNDKINVLYNAKVTQISGSDKVTAVTVESTLDNTEIQLPTDGVFIYIGMSPNTNPFKELGILTNDGYVITDDKMQTFVEGVFGAGDVRDKELRQIITATSDGAMAVQSTLKYLESYDD